MTAVISAPSPQEETLSPLYTLAVEGQNVPVYPCIVSAMPFNTVWPGYQRPLDQTEPAAFASWDQDGPTTVVVNVAESVELVKIVPAKLGITPNVVGNRITFRLDKPVPVVVAVNGWHKSLHLFANPPETNVPHADTTLAGGAHLRYFGPGVHVTGPIQVQSGDSLYLAAGAVVYGGIWGDRVHNVHIFGRGILDASEITRQAGHGGIRFTDSHDIHLDGIIVRDPSEWCIAFFGCRNCTIRNVKEIGLWRYNADGIDVCNSQNFVVEDCFLRTFDDSLVVKGLKNASSRNVPFDVQPCENITFRRNTIWCDWGRAMEIGAETCAPYYNKIQFLDSDIIRTTHIALDLQQGDRAYVHDVVFDDIRIDLSAPNPQPVYQENKEMKYAPVQQDFVPELVVIVVNHTMWSKDKEIGKTSDIVFRNLDITAPGTPRSSMSGADAEHDIRRVAAQNWTLNGLKLTSADQLGIACNQFAEKPTYTP